MKYVGSKNRLAKEIVPILSRYLEDNKLANYVEPFVGGANIIDKIAPTYNRCGFDTNPYLIALLRYAQEYPEKLVGSVSKEEYIQVRDCKVLYPDWFIGLVGFCYSYNSKFFGGYANNVQTKDGIRNYGDEALRNLKKQAPNLKGIYFECSSFLSLTIYNSLIYCDPPYKGTTGYGKATFQYVDYYDWCRRMRAQDNIVICSEYQMPRDFKEIWRKETKTTLAHDWKERESDRIEKLFILE